MTAEPPGIAAQRPRSPLHFGADAREIETFTQARVERILSLVVGFGCSVLGTQALLNAIGSEQEDDRWHLRLMIAVFAPLALMVLACFTGRYVRWGAALFAVVYPVALLVWPAATAGRQEQSADQPWIWYLINVATVAAIIAFPIVVQMIWAALVPFLYGGVRLAQVGVAPDDVLTVSLDVVFALILAGVLLTLAWMLRSVAVGTDATRAEAVRSYAAAAAADAAEKERVAVAALMHDSVLAALIAAERAGTDRERTLAVSMARDALTRLANADQDAGEGSDAPVHLASVADELERAARDLGFELVARREIARDAAALSGRVARALVLASTQAIANAVQHADAAGLAVLLTGDSDGVTIRVSDEGPGFDPANVPDDRLGIRASIMARIAAVAGQASVESSPRGTVVTLRWSPR